MIQKDLYISLADNSEFPDNVFDDDPFCNNVVDRSFMFDNELYKPVKMDDNVYHTFSLKSDSETSHYKPRSSKLQSWKMFPENFELHDTDTVRNSPTSFTDQKKFPEFQPVTNIPSKQK